MNASMKRPIAGLTAALLVTIAAAALLSGSGAAAAPQTGSITKVYSQGQCASQSPCWTCNGPVDLDSVSITVDTNAVVFDAVKLASGCTGRIGKLTITTQSADGVKITPGAHDLVIGGGSVTCTGVKSGTDQYAIRAFAGNRITFAGLTVNCLGTDPASLFVNQVGDETPTDIVFDQGWLSSARRTAILGTSTRAVVMNSTLCPKTGPGGSTLDIPAHPGGGGPPADNPLDWNNTFPPAC